MRLKQLSKSRLQSLKRSLIKPEEQTPQPKSDGYQAVHVTLNTPAGQRAEIRIQTETMHRADTKKPTAEGMDEFKTFVKGVLLYPVPDLGDD